MISIKYPSTTKRKESIIFVATLLPLGLLTSTLVAAIVIYLIRSGGV